jgi:hypothetical protein
MRNLGIIAGLILLVPTSAARAQESVASPASASVPTPAKRLELGASVLPMALGHIGGGQQALIPSTDAAFAYGIGVSLSVRIVAGLSVGLAPQTVFNVKGQDDAERSATEYDIMARVAYAHAVMPRLTVYGEVLPGYSVISLPSHLTNIEGSTLNDPTGFVLGFGAGAALDLADMFFVNLGLGYQVGFQQGSVGRCEFDFKTRYARIAFGGGMKF